MQHFTLEQLNAAEAKVKSGADFPNYMKELISKRECFVWKPL
jgi:hypothetical protein